jgi:hypothetical protein
MDFVVVLEKHFTIITTTMREEGVNLHFEQNVDDLNQFADSDII